jgi:hypothetical protein
MADKTPITDEWLSSVDFKWRQDERQPNKHWKLALNKVDAQFSNSLEQTTIEVQRCGWENRNGDYIGDPNLWMIWVTDQFNSRAFLGNFKTQEEIIQLAELITRRDWKPENHLYGQAWPEGSSVLKDRT